MHENQPNTMLASFRDEKGRWLTRPPTAAPLFAKGNKLSRGRPSMGLVVTEWVNEMAAWTLDEVHAVTCDAEQPAVKRVAARLVADACHEDARIAGDAFDRIMDRTLGKAVARNEISGPEGAPLQVEERRKATLAALSQESSEVLLTLADVMERLEFSVPELGQ